jgi:biopolymer transport protein ExbB
MSLRAIYHYYAENGGLINGAIFCVAACVLHIGLGKVLLFRKINRAVRLQTVAGKKMQCGRMIRDLSSSGKQYGGNYYRNIFREHLLELVPRLEAGLDTMATLIQVAPFLGLFGTVAGMIETFSLITTYGTGNPVVLTEGITVSLLTTQAGLLVAFPCMLFHNYLTGKKELLQQQIVAQEEAMLTEVTGKKEVADA